MRQVLQYQKTGEVAVEEVPSPQCPEGGILVNTAYSLISAGTEKISVTNAQGSLLERAKKQPDQVRTVIDTIKKEGILSTLDKVKSKLDSYKVLGYSASGTVAESRCDEFSTGDRVAAAGAGYAVHAGVIAIPKNLACKLPESVKFEDAAYTTVGTIALQGVRQADLRLGENAAVIGLGLIGQITVQLLKASGCRVIGMDINEGLFTQAIDFGCDMALRSDSESLPQAQSYTRGIGFDAVIITASADSNQPLELALKLARKKGKIVIVGAVTMNVPRSPFYEKELELRISCSYGPGRYDPNYEERGIDYPAGYIRWAENRNMQAFVDLLESKRMNVDKLTTHIFDIENAPKAYDIITGKEKEHHLGILLRYGNENIRSSAFVESSKVKPGIDNIKLGFVGAGNFAKFNLIPPLKETGIEFTAVSTATGANAKSAAETFGFKYSTTDSRALIKRDDVNLVFCATQHDTHSKYVIESINSGKPVFVEKPLCVTRAQLDEIDKAVSINNPVIMVGFNRRFSKPFLEMAEFYKNRTEPMVINYRVNAGSLPKTHWVESPDQGGRILGEACHFIDCMVFLTKALPIKVYAEQISTNNRENVSHETCAITIKFSDGSVGVIEYLSNGDSSISKELCTVFCEKRAAIMDNFRTLELISSGKTKKMKFDGKKGHREEIFRTIESLKRNGRMPIPYIHLRAVTLAAFAAEESMASGLPVIFDSL
ncbi:MAG: hypothetical protein QG635_483 [Bacteroidota bacterium]|nr:hypothetical protein [Bacteroidota bacterium]